MVEECQIDGPARCGCHFLDILACWDGLRVASMGSMHRSLIPMLPLQGVLAFAQCLMSTNAHSRYHVQYVKLPVPF